jgi:predicted lipoprotein with Yx(FWY)xxD motif
MRKPLFLLGAVLTAVVGAGLAACGGSTEHATHDTPHAAATPAGVRVEVEDSSLGPILTDQDGRTLYAFANDKGGTSTCTGDCIATWPALSSGRPATAGNGADKALLAQTVRAEGTAQTTYGDWPLYYYAGDQGPGDVDGQGVDGVWFAVGADGKLVKTAP